MTLPQQHAEREQSILSVQRKIQPVEILGRQLYWDEVYRQCRDIKAPADRDQCRFFKQLDRYSYVLFEATASDTRLTLLPQNAPDGVGFVADIIQLPEGTAISFAVYAESPEHAQRYGQKRYPGMPLAHQLTRSALDFFESQGHNIVAKRSEWRPGSRNHRELTAAINNRHTPEEATLMTWGGQNALDLGFTDTNRIHVKPVTNLDSTTTYLVDFFRPQYGEISPSRRDRRSVIR